MPHILLFIEGLLTFLSPCLLPMLPLYFAYFAASAKMNENGGEEPNPSKMSMAHTSPSSKAKRPQAALGNILFFLLGFTLVFMLMSLFITTVGRFINLHQTAINLIAGGLITLIGLDYLLGQRILGRLAFTRSSSQQKIGHPFVFGLLFAITWTPCVGGFLASALSYIATVRHAGQAFFLILSYCLGLGLPFLLSGLLLDEALKAFNVLKRHLTLINRIAGAFLIIFGLLTMSGLMTSTLSLFS